MLRSAIVKSVKSVKSDLKMIRNVVMSSLRQVSRAELTARSATTDKWNDPLE